MKNFNLNEKESTLMFDINVDVVDNQNCAQFELKEYRNYLKNSETEEVIDDLADDFNPNATYEVNKHLFYPILKEKQLAIIFGVSGEGKSILAVDIANQIATGKSLWSAFKVETEPQNVLYIDFELGASSFQNRYRTSKYSKNLIIKNVNVHNYNTHIGLNSKVSDKIDKAIKFIIELSRKNKSKVIFIDNLSNIADSLQNTRDADRFVSDLYGQMKDLDLTIVFVGHTTKLPKNNIPLHFNQLKGNSSLSKTFESIIGFKRSLIDKNISYLKQTKSRNLNLVFDGDTVPKFKFVDDIEVGWKLDYVGNTDEASLLEKSNNKVGRPVKYNDTTKFYIYSDIENGLKPKAIQQKYLISSSKFYNIIEEAKTDEFQQKYREHFTIKSN